jgi:hypothetical protein
VNDRSIRGQGSGYLSLRLPIKYWCGLLRYRDCRRGCMSVAASRALGSRSAHQKAALLRVEFNPW